MKILHLVAGGVNGGAGRGAYTLHLELLNLGIESVVLTDSNDDINYNNKVFSITNNRFKFYEKKIKSRFFNLFKLLYLNRQNLLFSSGYDGFDITHNKYFKQADIIHLHWINGLVNIKSLKKIKKPIIWTIRDMWPFTGGCHFGMIEKQVCTNYETGCGNCILLKSKYKHDLSYFILKNKLNNLPNNLHLVGISNWISNCIKNSLVFKNTYISTISNNIDVEKFYPTNKAIARNILNINIEKKKIILYGGLDATLFHKGISSFIELLSLIDKDKFIFIFFGNIDVKLFDIYGLNYKYFGLINDDQRLSYLYSSADLYISTSYLDSFGKTIAESMSCETPVLCFDATGPSDIVEHKISGYKAKPFDVCNLLDGLNWILSLNKSDYNNLSKQCRLRVINKFGSKKISLEYVNLYKSKLN